MDCVYSKVCYDKCDNCYRSCFRYLKFKKIVEQLNIEEDIQVNCLSNRIQGKAATIKQLFEQDANISIIYFNKYTVCQLLMCRYVFYIVNKRLMPINKECKLLNVTFNDVIDAYFNQGYLSATMVNECDVLILRNYYTITSPTGRKIMEDLVSSRVSKNLITIMLFETDNVNVHEGIIKHCITNHKDSIMTLNNSNITIECD